MVNISTTGYCMNTVVAKFNLTTNSAVFFLKFRAFTVANV